MHKYTWHIHKSPALSIGHHTQAERQSHCNTQHCKYTTVQIHNKYTNIQIHKYTNTQYTLHIPKYLSNGSLCWNTSHKSKTVQNTTHCVSSVALLCFALFCSAVWHTVYFSTQYGIALHFFLLLTIMHFTGVRQYTFQFCTCVPWRTVLHNIE